MKVRALMFASLRDVVGARAVEVELASEAKVADLSRAISERWPAFAPRLATLRLAVNDALVDAAQPLQEGDEVAYLPPVSGGAGDWIALIDEPIAVDRVLDAVKRNDCGAVVLFLGTVRDHFQGVAVIGMEYEAHKALAEQGLAELVEEARLRWPIGAVSLVHRTGRLALAEISVAVAVASPHRAEAFEAGRFIIDRLKQTVPIWKRELLENGEVWIEGEDRVPSRTPTDSERPT